MSHNIDWRLVDRQNEELYVAALERAGVILKGHFVLRSGKHGDTFVDIKGLYPHTRVAKDFARALALRIQRELGLEAIEQITGVVAPAMGGVILAHDTADQIGLMSQQFDREVLALFAEKNRDGAFYFGRGYDEYIGGKHWVVVEDVTTTGSATRELVELVNRLGGMVELACVVWNRGGVKSSDIAGAPLVSLISREIPAYEQAECAMCSAESAINTKHGRGAEYVAEHGQFGATA